MDYWISMRSLEISLKCSYEAYIISFDYFTKKESNQTNNLFINEWIWKHPYRFKISCII